MLRVRSSAARRQPVHLPEHSQTAPSPTARNRGVGPTGMVCSTTFVKALTRVRTFFSLLVTHTASSPKAMPNEPGATEISATT